MLGLPIVFSIMQVILLFFIPESPKYLLLNKNNLIKAEKGLYLVSLPMIFEKDKMSIEVRNTMIVIGLFLSDLKTVSTIPA